MFTADFETTTNEEDCRVWAWAICEIGRPENIYYGTNIESFFESCLKSGNLVLYFHNLKFDGEFCIHYLLKHGYNHTSNQKLKEGEFNTLISDMGQFYKIKIKFFNGNTLELRDSLKLLTFSVKDIAKAFDLPIQKLEIEYTAPREENHIMTQAEIDYITNDVKIMSLALQKIFDMGFTKLTQGSCALTEYKEIVGKKNFEKTFPKPDYDKDIRKCYKGGFTYLNPIYESLDIGKGIVLDVNSLYPSRMYYCKLPYGEPLKYYGEYKEDKLYPLYIQKFSCEFELKSGYLPTIQLKGNNRFLPTEYIESSDGDRIDLCLTSVDMELFFKHYEIYNIEYYEGWKFKASDKMFRSYIDKWMGEKIKAGKEGNKTLRNWAKVMLNSLYGKFALNPICAKKSPYLDGDTVRYKTEDREEREPIYLPVGAFITAYARSYTISTSQMIREYSLAKYGEDRYIYSDTDSIHTTVPIEDLEKLLKIDDNELGAWAHESTFTRARFIRAKTYIEEIDGKLHVTCAGMPDRCKELVTWENFKIGSVYEGKLLPSHVNGGIVLKETTFRIQG